MVDASTCRNQLAAEIVSLLQWAILAAATIGPGHILVFTIAGAKYDLKRAARAIRTPLSFDRAMLPVTSHRIPRPEPFPMSK